MSTEEIKAMLAALDAMLMPLLEAAVSIDEIDLRVTGPDAIFEANYDPATEKWLVKVS